MAMDGLMLYRVTQQLQQLCPCKINKIQNLSDEEIIFQLRTQQRETVRLILNLHSNTNRVYLSNTKESTHAPTNFVMVLRKQLNQSIIESIEQIHFDRILKIHLSTRNELGDYAPMDMYVELMGKYSNLLLVNKENQIIDCMKRIPIYENSKRFIHPGAIYTLPAQPEKWIPTQVKYIDKKKSLVGQIYGFSPLLSKEFLYRMEHGQSYESTLSELLISNTLYMYEKDFHIIELTHLKQPCKKYTIMEGLDVVYENNEKQIRIKEQYGDVLRAIEKEKKKNEKKLPKLEQSLEQSHQYEKYKEYGDLLFSYMDEVEKEPIIEVPAFDEDVWVRIPIDMRLDIKGNANKYYQKYHKLKRGEAILGPTNSNMQR